MGRKVSCLREIHRPGPMGLVHLRSGNLTEQWEIHHLKMYLNLLKKMVGFPSHVSLPECTYMY